MVQKPLLLAAALIVSAPSHAQTPPSTTQPGPTAPAPSATAPACQDGAAGTRGMQTLTTATVPLTYRTLQPTDVPASRLMGVNVYTRQDEAIGEIEDLLIENGRTVRAVILGVGGFLGVGERYVAVDPASITIMRNANTGAVRAVLDATRDQLRQAPAFDYSRRSR